MSIEEFRNITKQKLWSNHVDFLLNQNAHSKDTIQEFSTYWIKAGHHIREQIANDRLLVTLLRHILPTYNGNSVKLFRGENEKRWETGNVGVAWTTEIDVAKMFARGLNSKPLGGVLLEGYFKPEAIICGLNSHSNYLGEKQFTIDPFSTANIVVVEKFPPCYLLIAWWKVSKFNNFTKHKTMPPKASWILARRGIFFSLKGSVFTDLFLVSFYTVSSRQQQHIRWARCKQAVCDYTNDLINFCFHRDWVCNG
jgi:hypothetical protein